MKPLSPYIHVVFLHEPEKIAGIEIESKRKKAEIIAINDEEKVLKPGDKVLLKDFELSFELYGDEALVDRDSIIAIL